MLTYSWTADGSSPRHRTAILFERADLGVLVVRPRLADLHALGAFLQGRHRRSSRRDARARRLRPLPARRSGRRARTRCRRTPSLGSRCSAGAGDHAGGLSPTHPLAAGAGSAHAGRRPRPPGRSSSRGAVASTGRSVAANGHGPAIGGWAMTTDNRVVEDTVVERLRAQVLGALSERQRADQISGRPPLRGRRRAGPRTPAHRRRSRRRCPRSARSGAPGSPARRGRRPDPGGLRRPVPPRSPPAPARRPVGREHQRQRGRPGLGPLRRRPAGADRSHRRIGRGAGRVGAQRRGPTRDRRAALRPGLAPIVPPAPRRVPAVRGDGGGRPAVPLDPPPPLPEGHPRRPGRHGHLGPGAARAASVP